jgi:hypothetical protein
LEDIAARDRYLAGIAARLDDRSDIDVLDTVLGEAVSYPETTWIRYAQWGPTEQAAPFDTGDYYMDDVPRDPRNPFLD